LLPLSTIYRYVVSVWSIGQRIRSTTRKTFESHWQIVIK